MPAWLAGPLVGSGFEVMATFKRYFGTGWILVASVAILGCDADTRPDSPTFDAKSIATEADKGNLASLEDLKRACTAEVQANGERRKACKVQDDVRALRKPLNIRFQGL
jgi:hypothetical protein